MRVDKFEYGEVRYGDCMNLENGLPTLEDKSVDLCLTDPPYNLKKRDYRRRQVNVKEYKDNRKDYFEWCKEWFTELLRICNTVVFTCGSSNLFDWIQFKRPIYNLKYWYKPNVCSMDYTEPILIYGKKIKNMQLWGPNTFHVNIRLEKGLIHPYIRSKILWKKILEKINPISVLDPFLGSGTTAECATKLGIEWLGYELDVDYKVDIDKRLKYCKIEKEEATQLSLEGWQK